MVATALMSVAAVGLSSVFHGGLRLWRHSENEMSFSGEGRTVLNQIHRDFTAAVDVPGIGWSTNKDGISFAIFRGGGYFKCQLSADESDGLGTLRDGSVIE